MLLVYTYFCGEFIRKSDSSEKIANKYFYFKSDIIHEGNDCFT